ncbi:hypothetical protein GCM10023238_37320 [Streptomyces heliomycini]
MVIDISGVEIVDSFLGRVLAEIAAQAELLAARHRGGRHAARGRRHPVELGLTLPGCGPRSPPRRRWNSSRGPSLSAAAFRRRARGGSVMHTAAGVEARLPIRSDMDLVWVRQHVRQAAAQLGFGLVDQTKLVTAASELARNTPGARRGRSDEATHVRAGGARGCGCPSATRAPASPTSSGRSATATPPAAGWGWGWAAPGAWCTTSR